MKGREFYKCNSGCIKVFKSSMRKAKGKTSTENNVVAQVFYSKSRFIKDFYKRHKERHKEFDQGGSLGIAIIKGNNFTRVWEWLS